MVEVGLAKSVEVFAATVPSETHAPIAAGVVVVAAGVRAPDRSCTRAAWQTAPQVSDTELFGAATVTGEDTEAADCPYLRPGSLPAERLLNWSVTAYTYSPAASVPAVGVVVVGRRGGIERRRIDLARDYPAAGSRYPNARR